LGGDVAQRQRECIYYLKNLFDSHSYFSELFKEILIGQIQIFINPNNLFNEKAFYSFYGPGFWTDPFFSGTHENELPGSYS